MAYMPDIINIKSSPPCLSRTQPQSSNYWPHRGHQNISETWDLMRIFPTFYANEVECIKAQARDTLLGAEVQALMGIIR